jgi:hypothetical protein
VIKTSGDPTTELPITEVGNAKNFVMSLDFHQPAIAIGGHCRISESNKLVQITRYPYTNNRAANSTKRRRKILLDSQQFDMQLSGHSNGQLLMSTTTTSNSTVSNVSKAKRSISTKRKGLPMKVLYTASTG